MSHELSFFGSLAEMAYVGEKPWHGFGQEIKEGASVEEAILAANMGWTVERSVPNFIPANGVEAKDVPDHRVLYRSDTLQPLSIVSDRYKVVQPREVVEFFRSMIEQQGFSIETLGVLKGGRRIWAMCKTNMENEVVEADRILGRLLLITSYDKSLSTTAKFVSTRVVCWNTQHIALHMEKGQEVKVRHNTDFDGLAVKQALGLDYGGAFDGFLGRMRGLTKVHMTNNDAKAIVASLLPKPSGQKTVEESAGFLKIMGLFNGQGRGSLLQGVEGTAWGLLNAFTEYADHHARAHTKENRFDSAMFGNGANLKAAAESLLCEMI